MAEIKEISKRLLIDYKYARNNKEQLQEEDMLLFTKFKELLSSELKQQQHLAPEQILANLIFKQVNGIDRLLDGEQKYENASEEIKLLHMMCHYHYPWLTENLYSSFTAYFFQVCLGFKGQEAKLKSYAEKRYDFPTFNYAYATTDVVLENDVQDEPLEFPIFQIDLETRLMLDKAIYDDPSTDKESLEAVAFHSFYNHLICEFELQQGYLNDVGHSMELQMYKRDIAAIMRIINRYESHLQALISYNLHKTEPTEIEFLVLDMALRYRYALGLHDGNETFAYYWQRKMQSQIHNNLVVNVKYMLPTLAMPLSNIKNGGVANYIDELLKKLHSLAEKDDRFGRVRDEILGLLIKIELPSKMDWNVFQKGITFSYSEQRAIQGEVIYHLKNKLRDAYLNNTEHEISIFINALNCMYYMNLYVSGVQCELTPAMLPTMDHIDASYIQTGLLGISMNRAAEVYEGNIRMLGTRGHGIAAEKANDLIDKILLKDAKILGDNNALNGADRLVNGQLIQTKYCKTGGKCISECFKDGKFRYVADGKPMKIEVPKDKVNEAVQSLSDRIARGDLKDIGITDPEVAKEIVTAGKIKYKTAKQIAKAGTIEGISYDVVQGTIDGLLLFGLSGTMSFATAIWKGESVDEAFEGALKDSASIFGRHLVQYVVTQQLARTSVEKMLRPTTDHIVKNVLGSKNSAQIINTFFRNPGEKMLNRQAAMNKLSKLMRGGAVTVVVTTTVLSSGSIYDALTGRISGAQLAKNVGNTSASILGSTAGNLAGKAVGNAIGKAIGGSLGSAVPVVGTVAGSVVGGYVVGQASQFVLDALIDDDSIQTMETLKLAFAENIEELQLDHNELNYLTAKIFYTDQLSKQLKQIYAAQDQGVFIENLMEPYIHAVLKARPRIKDIDGLVEQYYHM